MSRHYVLPGLPATFPSAAYAFPSGNYSEYVNHQVAVLSARPHVEYYTSVAPEATPRISAALTPKSRSHI